MDNGGIFTYDIYTSTKSGSVKTKHFNEAFDADKIEKNLRYTVRIKPVDDASFKENYTLSLRLKKISMDIAVEGGSSKDYVIEGEEIGTYKNVLDHDQDLCLFNFTAPESQYPFTLKRFINEKDVKINKKLEKMPGFQLDWWYVPDDVQSSELYWSLKEPTITFRRCVTMFCI